MAVVEVGVRQPWYIMAVSAALPGSLPPFTQTSIQRKRQSVKLVAEFLKYAAGIASYGKDKYKV